MEADLSSHAMNMYVYVRRGRNNCLFLYQQNKLRGTVFFVQSYYSDIIVVSGKAISLLVLSGQYNKCAAWPAKVSSIYALQQQY